MAPSPCIAVPQAWWQSYLSVGVSVALLSVVGVLVPWLRGEKVSRSERALWTLLMMALAAMELWAIHEDQVQQAFERCEQRENFNAIATGLKQNLDSVMGTDSVPCIVPEPWAVKGGRIQLVLRDVGENDLTGVEVKLYSYSEYANSQSRFDKAAIPMGTVTPDWPKELPAFVPEIDGQLEKGVGKYFATITAQNGLYVETIDIRPSIDPRFAWGTNFYMMRDKHVNHDEKIGDSVIPQGATSASNVAECMAKGWSDEAH